jgi:hypothetical protein
MVQSMQTWAVAAVYTEAERTVCRGCLLLRWLHGLVVDADMCNLVQQGA